MSLPSPSQKYDPSNEAQFRAAVERALEQALRRGGDIDLGKGRLIITDDVTGERRAVTLSNGVLGDGPV